MRNMNCRNVRREIDEAGPGDLLSADLNAHLEGCAACATLSREQSKLQTIISNLGTVEAPGDFEFRLRARLAREKRGTAQPFALGNFSFGLRSAIGAALLLLIGSAFLFVSLRSRLEDSGTGLQVASRPATTSGVKVNAPPAAVEPNADPTDAVKANLASDKEGTQRRRRQARSEVAAYVAYKGSNRIGTRELSGTQAPVMRRDDQLAATYPTAAFPIDASYQSLKVSVDDGRGASRTISLPTVSFGSQRALSQSASPLMASSRGVW